MVFASNSISSSKPACLPVVFSQFIDTVSLTRMAKFQEDRTRDNGSRRQDTQSVSSSPQPPKRRVCGSISPEIKPSNPPRRRADKTAQKPSIEAEQGEDIIPNPNDDEQVTICGVLVPRSEGVLSDPTGRRVVCKHCLNVIDTGERRLKWPKKRSWGSVTILTHTSCFQAVQGGAPIKAKTTPPSKAEAQLLPCRVGREASCNGCNTLIRRGETRYVFAATKTKTAAHWHRSCLDQVNATDEGPNEEAPTPINRRMGMQDSPQPQGSGDVLVNRFTASPFLSSPTPPKSEYPDQSCDNPLLILPRFTSTAKNVELLWRWRKDCLQRIAVLGAESADAQHIIWRFLHIPGLLMVGTSSLRQNSRDREIKRRLDSLMIDENTIIYGLLQKAEVQEDKPMSTKAPDRQKQIRRAERLILAGEISKAAKSLEDPGSLQADGAVIQQLKDLHAYDEEYDGSTISGKSQTQVVINASTLLSAIKKLPKLSGCGCSGDTIDVWKAAVADRELLESLTDFVNEIANGKGGTTVYRAMTTSRMIAVPKKDGKPRPIAIGETLRRITTAALLIHVQKEVSEAVGPMQYGVGLKSGGHKAAFATQSLLEMNQELYATDITNAFGSLDRKELLRATATKLPALFPLVKKLYSGSTTHLVKRASDGMAAPIRCSKGVDQGCPASPLLFSLCMSEAISCIGNPDGAATPTGSAAIAYLDDVIINVTRNGNAVEEFTEGCKKLGLSVNQKKCFTLQKGYGHGVLGAPAFFGENIPYKKLTSFLDCLDQAKKDGLSAHGALVLLKLVGGSLTSFQFCFNKESPDSLIAIDERTKATLNRIVGDIDNQMWEKAILPTRLGGLGLSCAVQTEPLFKAGVLHRVRAKVEEVIGKNLADLQSDRLLYYKALATNLSDQGILLTRKDGFGAENQKTLSERLFNKAAGDILLSGCEADRAHLQSGSASHCMAWLFHNKEIVTDEVAKFAITARLRGALCTEHTCQLTSSSNGAVCNEMADRYGDHTFRCLRAGFSVRTHNAIRDTLLIKAETAGYAVGCEEAVDESAVMDLVLRSCVGNSDTQYVDVSICHPVCSDAKALRQRSNKGGAASERREYEKIAKYQALTPVGVTLTPFVMETTGRVGQKALKLLADLADRSGEHWLTILAALQTVMFRGCFKKFLKCNPLKSSQALVINGVE